MYQKVDLSQKRQKEKREKTEFLIDQVNCSKFGKRGAQKKSPKFYKKSSTYPKRIKQLLKESNSTRDWENLEQINQKNKKAKAKVCRKIYGQKGNIYTQTKLTQQTLLNSCIYCLILYYMQQTVLNTESKKNNYIHYLCKLYLHSGLN